VYGLPPPRLAADSRGRDAGSLATLPSAAYRRESRRPVGPGPGAVVPTLRWVDVARYPLRSSALAGWDDGCHRPGWLALPTWSGRTGGQPLLAAGSFPFGL